MTDQEKKSGASPGSSFVMVDQTTGSRHKSYRPTEMQDEAPIELHHKRSRAPAVPSVAEESSANAAINEQKEHEIASSEKSSEKLYEKSSVEPSEKSLEKSYEKPSEMSSEKLSEKPSGKPSEKHKPSVGKLSTKRSSSPEAITMLPLEEKRPDIVSLASQPIPVPVGPSDAIKDIDKTENIIDKENDDSLIEEIAELRTLGSRDWEPETRSLKNVPEIQETVTVQKILLTKDNEKAKIKVDPEVQETEKRIVLRRKSEIRTINNIERDKMKSSPEVQEIETVIPLQSKLESRSDNENITSTKILKKKEITWTQSSYLDKVPLQNLESQSLACVLDRKASVGPCFRKTLPYGQPSGITICLPKKSQKSLVDNIKLNKPGGISITVSKKCLNNTLKISSDFELGRGIDRVIFPRKANRIGIKIEDGNCVNILENLKGRIENWRGKIKHALHI